MFEILQALSAGYRVEFFILDDDDDKVTVQVINSYNMVEGEKTFDVDDEEGILYFLGRFW